MTHDEILQGLYDHTLVGHAPEVRDLVNAGLDSDLTPERIESLARPLREQAHALARRLGHHDERGAA